jgi:hypothetical protein
VYSITLHPLAKYPGPLIWTVTKLPHVYHTIRGDLSFHVAEIHKQYGHIIRISPTELSYIEGQAWNDIYGLRPKKYELKKDSTGVGITPGRTPGLLLTQSDKDHTRMRKNLSPGFSDKALRAKNLILSTTLTKSFKDFMSRWIEKGLWILRCGSTSLPLTS